MKISNSRQPLIASWLSFNGTTVSQSSSCSGSSDIFYRQNFLWHEIFLWPEVFSVPYIFLCGLKFFVPLVFFWGLNFFSQGKGGRRGAVASCSHLPPQIFVTLQLFQWYNCVSTIKLLRVFRISGALSFSGACKFFSGAKVGGERGSCQLLPFSATNLCDTSALSMVQLCLNHQVAQGLQIFSGA